MQILRDEEDFACAIASWPDQEIVRLLQARLAFYAEFEEPLHELFKLVLMQPGDRPEELDVEFVGAFLINRATGLRHGEEGFRPLVECVDDYPSFYAMLFCVGDDGFNVEVIVPKRDGVDEWLLDLCARFATEAPQTSP